MQGSPYPITPTTSFSTPLGSGDYAVYMGATGALADVTGNDVWQQGVGPSVNSDVPTTDINGVARSGATCNPGAFEADGFVAPTVLTRTIGSGKDYASFTLAEADVTNIGSGTDLTFENEAIVFEADAATYAESVTFQSGLTSDATRNVTYRAASGAGHNGVFGGGVHITRSGADTLTIRDSYTAIDGLSVARTDAAGYACYVYAGAIGVILSSCMLDAAYRGFVTWGSSDVSCTVYNCVIRANNHCAIPFIPGSVTATNETDFINCTLLGTAGSSAIYYLNGSPGTAVMLGNVVNCVDLRGSAMLQVSSATLTGSNNFASSGIPGALPGSPYPVTATTDLDPGPGDWAIYDATNGALIDDPDNDVLAGGIGPDANPDVPTTDILGNTRSGATTDPGAFQISSLTPPAPALITIMRQIYQQDASFTIGASSAGVEKITHQLGPASADYFTINSTTSATVSVPRTAHALRVICVVASKACDVTLDLDASNSVYLGSIGGVASVQTDLTYFWSFGQVVSDGTYPRVRIADDGFSGDQLVYLWWHLA